jgi:small GTP-binding protein
MAADSNNRFKAVIVGTVAVGKTNILKHIMQQGFSPASLTTERYDRHEVVFEFDSGGSSAGASHPLVVRVDLWDTAGQEVYRSMTPLFYRDAKLCIIVYDVTNRSSFVDAKWWYTQFLEYATPQFGPPPPVLLVGNKADMEHLREVRQEEAWPALVAWSHEADATGQIQHQQQEPNGTACEHGNVGGRQMSDLLRLFMSYVYMSTEGYQVEQRERLRVLQRRQASAEMSQSPRRLSRSSSAHRRLSSDAKEEKLENHSSGVIRLQGHPPRRDEKHKEGDNCCSPSASASF